MEQLTFDLSGEDSSPVVKQGKRGSGSPWRVDDDGRECARCSIYKPWDQFSISAQSPRGRHSYCMPCKRRVGKKRYEAKSGEINAQARAKRLEDSDRLRARDRAAYHRNGARNRALGRDYYARNAEKIRGKARRFRQEHPERVAVWELRISARRAGQDPDVIEAHFLSHDGVCDICKKPPQETGTRCGRLAIDHDHATGEFRGLLCSRCNRGIGMFGDDPALLAAAVEYLKREAA